MKDKLNESSYITINELRQMEVIDLNLGKRLGFISDLIFDDELSKIEYLVIPPEDGILSVFKRREDYIISWDQVKNIGVDVILVDTTNNTSNKKEDEG